MDLDAALTFMINLSTALGAGYIGASFVLFMAARWDQLGKKKVAAPVNIPLDLKLKSAELMALELEQIEAVGTSVTTQPGSPEPSANRTDDVAEPSVSQSANITPPVGNAAEAVEASEARLELPEESSKAPLEVSLKPDSLASPPSATELLEADAPSPQIDQMPVSSAIADNEVEEHEPELESQPESPEAEAPDSEIREPESESSELAETDLLDGEST